MALKPCRECSKRVSTEAITCPNCGIPYPTNNFKEKKLKSDYGYARCEKNFCENKFKLLKVQKKLIGKQDCRICGNILTKVKDEHAESYIDENKSNENEKSIVSHKKLKKNKEYDYDIKTFLDGEMNLGPAFWLYGGLAGIVIGVVTGYLSSTIHPGWGMVYFFAILIILVCLWKTASKHIETKKENNESPTWGIVVKAIVILSAIGLLRFLIDLIKLLDKMPPL